mgnify:CR=1 FL=1
MIDFRLFHFTEIDSTNNEAKRNIFQYPHGSVVYADAQTAGKGRLNRTWMSPPNKNLYLSLILKEADVGYENLNSYVQIAALAIWKTLIDLGIAKALIKWPNDVLVDESKIAGILCESVMKKGKIEALIIGIGLNINMTKEDFLGLNRAATSIHLELGLPYKDMDLFEEVMHDWQTRNNAEPFWTSINTTDTVAMSRAAGFGQAESGYLRRVDDPRTERVHLGPKGAAAAPQRTVEETLNAGDAAAVHVGQPKHVSGFSPLGINAIFGL